MSYNRSSSPTPPGDRSSSSSSTITPLVAQHYNSIQEKGIDARKESRIFFMRAFNNWIKSMLIGDVIKRLKQDSNNTDLTILDMCCGKGGDIQKWVKSNAVKHVVFADIAATSVEQCKDRYKNLHRGGHRGGGRFKEIFTAEFVTSDCTKDTLKSHYSDPSIQFDLVSVQFSFHYSFESMGQALKMLQNVSDNLAKGGYFVGTTPNANRIVKLLRNASPSKQFGNEVYNIRFESDEEPFPIFGAKYYFQLDEVVDCPEFLVNFQVLEKLAARFNLKLVYKYPFEDFFNMMLHEGHFLLDKMQALQTYPPPPLPNERLISDKPIEYKHAKDFLSNHPDILKVGTLSKSEWEAVCLYLVFCFQKV